MCVRITRGTKNQINECEGNIGKKKLQLGFLHISVLFVSFFAQEIRVQRHLENPRFIDHIQSNNIYWLRSYGGTNADAAQHTQQTIDGEYIVAGYTYSYGAGNEDGWVLKTDSEGEIEWQKAYDNSYLLDYGSSGDIILNSQLRISRKYSDFLSPNFVIRFALISGKLIILP